MSESKDNFYSWVSQNQVSDIKDLMDYVLELEKENLELKKLSIYRWDVICELQNQKSELIKILQDVSHMMPLININKRIKLLLTKYKGD